jgi:hypothetical protein
MHGIWNKPEIKGFRCQVSGVSNQHITGIGHGAWGMGLKNKKKKY